MDFTLSRYIFELTVCTVAFGTLLYVFHQSSIRQNPWLTWFAVVLSVLLPAFNFSAHPMTEEVYGRIAAWSAAVTYSGNFILMPRDFLGLLYLLGFAYFAFVKADAWVKTEQLLLHYAGRYQSDTITSLTSALTLYTSLYTQVDNLKAKDFSLITRTAAASRSTSKFALFIVEIIFLLFWWHPVLRAFDSEFKKNCAAAVIAEEQQKPNRERMPYAVMLLISGLLMFLFSFNQLNRFSIFDGIMKADARFNTFAYTPLFDLQKTRKGTVLDWGSVDLPVQRLSYDKRQPMTCQVKMMNRPYFKEIKDADIKLYKDGEKQRLINIEAVITGPDFEKRLRAVGREEFKKYVAAVASQREVTIVLRLETEFGETWVTALALTRYARMYLDHAAIADLLGENSLFNFQLQKESPYYRTENASLDKEEEEAVYQIKWGEMNILLEKYANPNVYRGWLETDLKVFEAQSGAEIQILKNGESQNITKFSLRRYDAVPDASELLYEQPESTTETYAVRIEESKLRDCAPGTHFTFYIRIDDIEINTADLQIIDPYKPYYPLSSAARVPTDAAEFTYQVINLPGRSTILKTDTLAEENRKFLEIYNDRSRYEIIHVPDFVTGRRLVIADDFIWWEGEEKNLREEIPFLYLPEYTAHIGQPVGLLWGDLFANTNSPMLSREDIRRNARRPLRLQINGKEVPMTEFEMVVRRGEEEPQIHRIKRKKGEFMLPDFTETEVETSIFLQKIIVKTETGRRWLPVNFAFHIGSEPTDFSLSAEEVTPGGVRFDTLVTRPDTFSFAYQNHTLREVLSAITGYSEHYFRVFGPERNPTLNIAYHSDKINNYHGKALLIGQLRRRYRFSFQDKFETLSSYRLGVGSESKLNNFALSAEKSLQTSPQAVQNGAYEVLEAATLQDLRAFLEKKFNIYVYVVSGADSAYYFSLDTSSLEAVIEQLKNDYGLLLIHGNYPVRFLDIRFL